MAHVKEYDLFLEEKTFMKSREQCVEKVLKKKLKNVDLKAVRVAKMKGKKEIKHSFKKEELQSITEEMKATPTQRSISPQHSSQS